MLTSHLTYWHHVPLFVVSRARLGFCRRGNVLRVCWRVWHRPRLAICLRSSDISSIKPSFSFSKRVRSFCQLPQVLSSRLFPVAANATYFPCTVSSAVLDCLAFIFLLQVLPSFVKAYICSAASSLTCQMVCKNADPLDRTLPKRKRRSFFCKGFLSLNGIRNCLFIRPLVCPQSRTFDHHHHRPPKTTI